MGPIQSAMNQAVQTGAAAATMTTHFGEQLAQKQIQKAEQREALSSEAYNLNKQLATEKLQESSYTRDAEGMKATSELNKEQANKVNISNRDEAGKFRSKEAQDQAKEVRKNLLADSILAREASYRYTDQANFYKAQKQYTLMRQEALKEKKDAILNSGLYTPLERAKFNNQFADMVLSGIDAGYDDPQTKKQIESFKARVDADIKNPNNREAAANDAIKREEYKLKRRGEKK